MPRKLSALTDRKSACRCVQIVFALSHINVAIYQSTLYVLGRLRYTKDQLCFLRSQLNHITIANRNNQAEFALTTILVSLIFRQKVFIIVRVTKEHVEQGYRARRNLKLVKVRLESNSIVRHAVIIELTAIHEAIFHKDSSNFTDREIELAIREIHEFLAYTA